MLSKDEIFKKHSEPIKINGSWEFDFLQKEKAIEAMDEYAKQKVEPIIEGLRAIQSACNGKDVIWTMAEKIIQDAK